MGRGSQMSFRIRHVQGTISPEIMKSSDGHWIEGQNESLGRSSLEVAADDGELSV